MCAAKKTRKQIAKENQRHAVQINVKNVITGIKNQKIHFIKE